MPVSFNADGGASSRFPHTSEHKQVSLDIADIAGRVGCPNAAVAMLKFCWDKIFKKNFEHLKVEAQCCGAMLKFW